MRFIMHLTIQNIKRRRARTILTLLGVMIGVVAVASLVSLGIGVKKELLSSYGNETSIRSITIRTTDHNRNKKLMLTDHTLEKLIKLDKVKHVYPRYEVPLILQVDQYSTYASLVGIPREELDEIELTSTSKGLDSKRKLSVILGNSMSYLFVNENTCIAYEEINGDLTQWIGKKAKATFGYGENEINDRICISGVIKGDADDFSEQSQSIYCDMDVLASYLKAHAVNGIALEQPVDKNGNPYSSWVYTSAVVEVGELEDVEFVIKKLQDMGYQTSNEKEYRDTAMRTVRILEIFLGGIGLIAFLVALIGIGNTMTTAVYDRVTEIGTLKVLGCEKRMILSMILLESGIYGLIGGACGVMLSVLFGNVINKIAVSALMLDSGTKLAVITPGLVVGIILMAMIFGMAAGCIPARWAANLSPLTAMRGQEG